MSESELTKVLIKNLQKKEELKKIDRQFKNKKVEFRREIGNSSFRADIFITLQKGVQFNPSKLDNTNFIAIEVKIKDWRQGFYQAWRYNSFAEKSYLAIYKKYSKNIDVSLFIDNNIGLIVFDENEINVVNHPKQRTFKKHDSYSISLRKKIWNSLPSVERI